MPTGNLPKSAKALWEDIYNKAKAAGDSEEKAAKKAWGGVKNAGWRKVGDKWVKKAILSEFSLHLERASYDKATNTRRWRAVASDTDEDKRGDNMSLELFNDFISRIKSGEQVPEEFRSDFWSGGMPYISIAHYSDLNGLAVPGEIIAVYIDGNRLKSKGTFNDTVLGRRCFEAITEDLYGVAKSGQDKVRISIAFLDWMHRHKGSGFIFERNSIYDVCPECIRESIEEIDPQGKVFLRGHLIHEALTRVPVNGRTSMEVDKSMAKIRTRKDDAASIIGEDEVEKLETLQAEVGRSQVLVEFSDTEEDSNIDYECPDGDEECEEKKKIEESGVAKAETTEEVKVDASYGEEVYRPYGGATSLKDAMKQEEARQEYFRLADLWGMFSSVMNNIFADPEIEDKAKHMKKCVDEFQSMVEAKSLTILSKIEEMLEKSEHVEPATEPAIVTPIDEPLANLVKTFAEVTTQTISPDEKLVIIQQSYAELGAKIVETVRSQTNQPEPEQVQGNSVDNSQVAKLTDVVNSLSQKFDLLMAKLADNQAHSGPNVPARRSIQPQPFNPTQNQSLVATNPGQPVKISDFARKSVGLE